MSYLCNFSGCFYNTENRKYFNKHVIRHTNTDSFRCSVSACSYKTHRKDHLKQHKINKHPPQPSYMKMIIKRTKPYICPERNCYIEFETSKSLRDHIYTHNDNYTDIEVLSESEEVYNAIILND